MSRNGKLPGTSFDELYKMNVIFRETVKECGGPKKFVESHPERFEWVVDCPGGSVTLAKAPLSRTAADALEDLLKDLKYSLPASSAERGQSDQPLHKQIYSAIIPPYTLELIVHAALWSLSSGTIQPRLAPNIRSFSRIKACRLEL